MGCGRCEKPKMSYRKGLWSPEEDQKLKDYILRHGHGCWSAVPAKAGLQRNGKSCRLRWINYLRPGLKRGIFSAEEEQIILSLHAMLGNKWSQIAMHLPGRTDNEVKNYWNSYVKKKVMKVEGAGPVKETKPPNWTHQNMETTQEEPNNQISNCESLGSLKLSSPDSGHSMTQRTEHSSPEGTPLNHFPKVLFADWLSMDYANNHILSNLDGEISMHFDSKNSNAEQSFKPGYSQEAGCPTDGFLHGFEDSSIDGKVRSQFEHVFGNPGDSVFDLLSMNETFLDMNFDDLSF